MMKLLSTFIIFAAAWIMAVAWPKDTQGDNKLLYNIMKYLESETIKNVELPSQKPAPGATNENYETQDFPLTHVYSLDMRVPSETCPPPLKLSESNNLRLCGKNTGSSCNSVTIPTFGKMYNRVVGVIRAYQFGSPDCFANHGSDINGIYVDGISVTYDSAPRKHLWTYTIGIHNYVVDGNHANTCPSTGVGQAQPSFVEGDYFCSSGNPGSNWNAILYTIPLWANIQGDCSVCSFGNNLYFCVNLASPSNSDIEVRLCMDQDLNDEDVRIETMDFYVQ